MRCKDELEKKYDSCILYNLLLVLESTPTMEAVPWHATRETGANKLSDRRLTCFIQTWRHVSTRRTAHARLRSCQDEKGPTACRYFKELLRVSLDEV